MKLILAGSNIKTVKDFHNSIMEILDFPGYYGKNLDALWDCLTSDIQVPCVLVWKDFKISKKYLGDFAERAMNVHKEAEAKVEGFKIEKQ